jgi:hypothetical protein
MSSHTVALGLNWEIFATLIFFWAASIVCISFYLPIKYAMIIATLKIMLAGTFFIFWGDGSWFIGGDDDSYTAAGVRMIESGENPISIWFSPVGEYILIGSPSLALYHWWNMLWMWVFAPHYYAPVIANVFVTTLSGLVFVRILGVLGFGEVYRAGFAIFFLLHWDILVWSSFLNLKEPLITLLLLLTIYSILELNLRKWIYVLPLGLSIFLLFGIRFYLPALIGAAAVVYLLLASKQRLLVLAMVVGISWLVLWKYWYTLGLVERLIDLSPKSILKHTVKQFLSPMPWRITEPASYLVIPSILHWVFLPAGVLGATALVLTPKATNAWLIVLTFLSGVAFYAVIPGLASVRHGAPFAALWVLFEYHAIFLAVKMAVGQENRPAGSGNSFLATGR